MVRLADRPGLALVAVALLALVLSLPGFASLPPIDRDEARFAQAARQMAETGDFIDIRLGEGTRYKKPAGIYWLQSASVRLLGPEMAGEIWAYRLPSLVAAVTATILTYLMGRALAGPRVAFLSAVLLAASFLLGAEARLAKTDATLLATILAAQLVLARLHMQGAAAVRGAWPYLFWAALGLSILVKGPIGVMVVGLTLAALCALRREVRWLAALRPLRGVVLTLAIALPWYVLISVRAGSAFWDEALGRDLLGKITEGQESHGAPPGTYLLAVWLTFWPSSLLLPFAFRTGVRDWRTPAVAFCLAAILPTWLVFELTSTKLLHYVLPTYPALAILTAMGWQARNDGATGRAYLAFVAVLSALAAVLAGVALWFSFRLGGGVTAVWVVGIAISAVGVGLVWSSLRAGLRFAPLVGICALSFGFGTSFYGQLARLEPLWPSERISDLFRAAPAECADPVLISVGYEEPSLYLATDRWPVFAGPSEAADRARAAPCAFVVVTEAQVEAFEQAMGDASRRRIGGVAAFTIGNGREIDLAGFAVP